MDEEQLKQQFKEIMAKMTDGCDNLIELKSKCMFCTQNVGPYEDKAILCMKKLDNEMA